VEIGTGGELLLRQAGKHGSTTQMATIAKAIDFGSGDVGP
jgi:hypothetical protein